MFGDRTFAVMIATSFVLAMVVPLYSLEAPKLLERSGIDQNWVPAVMTVGQLSEFPALLLLAFCMRNFGMQKTFLIGMTAWLARYLIFALTIELPAVLTAIAMHGICHVFLIIVIQLYVDAACRSDLRASAQNLFAFVTVGIGMPIGFLLGGMLGEWSVDPVTNTASYGQLFALPAAIILVVMVVYCRGTGLWPRSENKETVETVGEALGDDGGNGRASLSFLPSARNVAWASCPCTMGVIGTAWKAVPRSSQRVTVARASVCRRRSLESSSADDGAARR